MRILRFIRCVCLIALARWKFEFETSLRLSVRELACLAQSNKRAARDPWPKLASRDAAVLTTMLRTAGRTSARNSSPPERIAPADWLAFSARRMATAIPTLPKVQWKACRKACIPCLIRPARNPDAACPKGLTFAIAVEDRADQPPHRSSRVGNDYNRNSPRRNIASRGNSHEMHAVTRW